MLLLIVPVVVGVWVAVAVGDPALIVLIIAIRSFILLTLVCRVRSEGGFSVVRCVI
jgi:putative effector of murein hydrolase LrgA (UPF0299 family)